MNLYEVKLEVLLKVIVAGFVLMNGTMGMSENTKDTPEPQMVKVAAAQVEIHTGKEIDIIVKYINKAGQDKAQLIVFGEYLLGSFYNDSSEGIQRISKAARDNYIYVIVGGWEEYERGAFAARKKGCYSNTALLFDRAGKIIGKYKKTHAAVGGPPHFWPPKGNENEWLMKPGDGYPVFDLDFGRIGIMTCYDGYFPESPSILSLKGAEIIAWINGRGVAIEDYIVKTDMFRNYCAMITTNFATGSGTMIGTWPNRILAHVSETGNHYIIVELDMAALRDQRKNSRVFHQRRPEIYGELLETHKPWEVYEKKAEN